MPEKPTDLPERLVVKLGTGVLTAGIGEPLTERVEQIAAQLGVLAKKGVRIILVSSGAIGIGMGRLGLKKRPRQLADLQSCAAVGQSQLTEIWHRALQPHGLTAAQILLTRDDVRGRSRHVALMQLFDNLLARGVVPVVNENDSISAEEIRFGDNDILSALIASLVKADLLAILSTAPGLIDLEGTGRVIPLVPMITSRIEALAGGTSSPTAVGGMLAKIEAAKVATRSGCTVYVGEGAQPNALLDLVEGRPTGTLFLARDATTLSSRQRWLAFFERQVGEVRIDAGAVAALLDRGSSLLAKGIVSSEGDFQEGDAVGITGPDGSRIGCGLTTFGAADLRRIQGLRGADIRSELGGARSRPVIHRSSLVLFPQGENDASA